MKRYGYSMIYMAAILLTFASPVSAQTLSQSGINGDAVLNPPHSGPVPDGTPLTQSLSNAIVPLNSVSCNSGGGSAENSYLRRFHLSADHGITSPFGLSSVDIGLESIVPGGAGACAGNPVDINVYSIPSGAPLTFGALTLVETVSIDLAGTPAPGIVNIPLPDPGAVDGSTDDLVIEMNTCDHSSLADGGFEFIGSNGSGQLRDTYLASTACGLPEPTPTGAIGFPNMHWVLTAYGDGLEPPEQARFFVGKDFDDDNEAEVEVTLTCNTGLPLSQPTTISEGDPVNFVIGDFEQGALNCEVTEVTIDGYTASYDDGDGISADNCSWEGLTGGQYTCNITNSLQQSEVVVTKEWIDENPQFNAINYAEAFWSCSNVATDGFGGTGGGLDFLGNPGSDSFFVYPDWENGTTCTVSEVFIADGGVEIDDSDCQTITLFPGEDAACTIVNTRLYAGIPTLSHYGLGVLAILMLGMGFVGFRRFV